MNGRTILVHRPFGIFFQIFVSFYSFIFVALIFFRIIVKLTGAVRNWGQFATGGGSRLGAVRDRGWFATGGGS